MWLTQADRQKAVDLPATTSQVRLPRQSKHATVFLVHADPASRGTLAEMLDPRFDVRQFESGEQAIEALDEDWPDVVVVDVLLQGLDGVETCRQLKARPGGQAVPVVLITARDRPGDRSRALEAGADDFISAPIYASELAVRVGTLVKLAWYERQQAIASERLRTLQTQLEEAERLATMGTFASGLGHELNNVVTVLRATLDDVRRSNVDCDVLTDLRSATSRLEELAGAVRRLGAPSRAESMLDLRDVVRDVVWMTRVVGRTKYVSVELSLPDAPVVARVAAVQAQQVVLNLVTNAADALTVASSGRIAIRLASDNGWVELCVQDNGPGFPPEVREHDHAFFTTKRVGLGTGLGLPLVRQLVASWAGTLEVDSSSAGTTVTARFPSDCAAGGCTDAMMPSPERGRAAEKAV